MSPDERRRARQTAVMLKERGQTAAENPFVRALEAGELDEPKPNARLEKALAACRAAQKTFAEGLVFEPWMELLEAVAERLLER